MFSGTPARDPAGSCAVRFLGANRVAQYRQGKAVSLVFIMHLCPSVEDRKSILRNRSQRSYMLLPPVSLPPSTSRRVLKGMHKRVGSSRIPGFCSMEDTVDLSFASRCLGYSQVPPPY